MEHLIHLVSWPHGSLSRCAPRTPAVRANRERGGAPGVEQSPARRSTPQGWSRERESEKKRVLLSTFLFSIRSSRGRGRIQILSLSRVRGLHAAEKKKKKQRHRWGRKVGMVPLSHVFPRDAQAGSPRRRFPSHPACLLPLASPRFTRFDG